MKKLIVFLFLPFTPVWGQGGPTMGWSSWNTYGVNISDALIRSQADAMVATGLNGVGYDDGFFGGRNTETGELIIHPDRFPNGLKPVADYIHDKGLKAGIYSDAGANTCGNMYNGDKLSVNVGFYKYDQHDADFYFKELDGSSGNRHRQRIVGQHSSRYTVFRCGGTTGYPKYSHSRTEWQNHNEEMSKRGNRNYLLKTSV